MKTNLIKKIGVSLMFPALAVSLLLFSPHLLSNVDNSELKMVAQDTTLQESPINIVGKVVDLDHQPLEGVVVRDNNREIELLTDGQGKFEFSFDTATVVSFTKMGFYNVDFNAVASDSNLVIILTPDSKELIVKGYNSPELKIEETEWFDIDTTSTLKEKYDLRKDSIESMKMKTDKWKKNMNHDMDTTKNHKDVHHHMNDTTKKINNGVIDIE